MVPGPLTNVRAGRHACFDRLVIDVKGAAPGYTVKYVTNVFTEGQGAVVPLRGGAKLLIVTRAPAYTATGASSYTPANRRELVNLTGLHDVPPGRVGRDVRGPDLDGAGRAGTVAVPRLHDPRRDRQPPGHRRRPPLVMCTES